MKNDGGAAFPIPNATDMDGYVYAPETRGMSLRDYMAGQALESVRKDLKKIQKISAHMESKRSYDLNSISSEALAKIDAILAAPKGTRG